MLNLPRYWLCVLRLFAWLLSTWLPQTTVKGVRTNDFFIPCSQQHVNCDTQGFHGYSNISWHLSSQTFVVLKCSRSNSLFTSLGTLPVRHKHLFLSPLKWSTWSQVTGFFFPNLVLFLFQCFLNYIVNLLKYSRLKTPIYVLN